MDKIAEWLESTGHAYTTERLAKRAKELGKPVSREYIRQLCDAGTIQASKPGRDWLISETAGNAWLFVWLRG